MTLVLHYVSVGITGCAGGEGFDEWAPGHTSKCSVSSYDGLERFLESHGPDIAIGAPVVDLMPLEDHPRIVRLAWDAPMCDPSITDDTVDRWGGCDDLGLAPLIAGHYFGALGVKAAITKTVDEPGPFDRVSPARLAAYWQSHDARVGHWDGNQVNWDAR